VRRRRHPTPRGRHPTRGPNRFTRRRRRCTRRGRYRTRGPNRLPRRRRRCTRRRGHPTHRPRHHSRWGTRRRRLKVPAPHRLTAAGAKLRSTIRVRRYQLPGGLRKRGEFASKPNSREKACAASRLSAEVSSTSSHPLAPPGILRRARADLDHGRVPMPRSSPIRSAALRPVPVSTTMVV